LYLSFAGANVFTLKKKELNVQFCLCVAFNPMNPRKRINCSRKNEKKPREKWLRMAVFLARCRGNRESLEPQAIEVKSG